MSRKTHPLDAKSSPARPTVRAGPMRKLGKDGTSWTPTEQRKRNQLLRQFTRTGRKGGEVSSGNSEAYREGYDAIDWRSDHQKLSDAMRDALKEHGGSK